MARLRSTVHVRGPEGLFVALPAGSEAPEWAVEQITNPDVWETQPDTPESTSQEPPRAGRGSGRDEWAAFAQSHDVTVDEDDSRDDIIATLAERGVIEG